MTPRTLERIGYDAYLRATDRLGERLVAAGDPLAVTPAWERYRAAFARRNTMRTLAKCRTRTKGYSPHQLAKRHGAWLHKQDRWM